MVPFLTLLSRESLVFVKGSTDKKQHSQTLLDTATRIHIRIINLDDKTSVNLIFFATPNYNLEENNQITKFSINFTLTSEIFAGSLL